MKKVFPNKEAGYEIPVIGGNGEMGYTEYSNTIEDTLVVGRVGAHCGNVHKIQGQSWVTDNALKIRLTTDQINKDFLKYSLIGLNLNQFANRNAQPLITGEIVKSKSILLASLEEQTLIARFLDQKTSQIDRLIGQKEKLLKLLAEKRTAIITQAVTKGLDPDVEMKDSGIDWLGEIPKHWIPKRLKFLTNKIIDGTHSTPEYLSEGVPFLRVTDIVKSNGGELNPTDFKYISQEEHEELIKRCNPEKGDLLYSKNGTIGIPRVVDWDFEFSIFVSLCLIKIKQYELEPDFLSYSLQSKLTENQISIGAKKSAVTNLHLDKIKEFVIPYPPPVEQKLIVEWLNNQLPKFKNAETKLIDSINQLKEYREALITSAVTGQIDVKEVVE